MMWAPKLCPIRWNDFAGVPYSINQSTSSAMYGPTLWTFLLADVYKLFAPFFQSTTITLTSSSVKNAKGISNYNLYVSFNSLGVYVIIKIKFTFSYERIHWTASFSIPTMCDDFDWFGFVEMSCLQAIDVAFNYLCRTFSNNVKMNDWINRYILISNMFI